MQSSKKNTATLQQAIDQRDREVTQLRQMLASKKEESHDLSTRKHQVALQDEQATPMKPVTIESLPDVPANIGYGSSAVIGDKAYFNSYGLFLSSATISGTSYHLAQTTTSLLSVLMTCSQLWGEG